MFKMVLCKACLREIFIYYLCIPTVYTMADIFENTIVCDQCNKKTEKGHLIKEGFRLRAWRCKECNKEWLHPLDLQDYKNFSKIRNKNFSVKLRLVGNSYTVSIPREIIEFEEEMQKEINQIIKMTLEEPEKLSLFFSGKRLKRVI